MRRQGNRKGTILIVTMWIILVLTALVLVLARSMRVEAVCSANESSSLRADAVEQGAIQYVLAHVDSLHGTVPTAVDMPCEAVHVGDGAFWIIRPNFDDNTTMAYGIVDEASKVNLNTASLLMLSSLPDMTSDLAASIINWRSSGSAVVTTGGAPSSYYLSLSNPYQSKNASLETVEELFLIEGATKQIIFGQDANRNGILDAGDDANGDPANPPSAQVGSLDLGLFPFVTVYSAEPNTDANGNSRINVNTPQTQNLSAMLQKYLPSKAATVLAAVTRARRLRPFSNILDFYARSGLSPTDFAAIADEVTTRTETVLTGLINVSTAPAQVLACLPSLADSDVSALLSKRADSSTDLTNIAWVTQAIPAAKAVAIGNSITARSFHFSADIVSVASDGRAFRRCRIVVNARSSPPKVVYRQDLTYLGWPLDPDITAKLRSGVPIDQIVPTQIVNQEVLK